MATCIRCEEEYNDRRRELGYRTCLNCGGREANRIARDRTEQTLRSMTPNHYEASAEALLDDPANS